MNRTENSRTLAALTAIAFCFAVAPTTAAASPANHTAMDFDVIVVEARNLANADGLFGKNDAYATVKVADQQYKTQVRKDAGSQAKWNESFSFASETSDGELSVQVWDQDLLQDELIGQTRIPLRGVSESGEAENWYTLGKGEHARGEVHLVIRARPAE